MRFDDAAPATLAAELAMQTEPSGIAALSHRLSINFCIP
jgi:hypothetical protein